VLIPFVIIVVHPPPLSEGIMFSD